MEVATRPATPITKLERNALYVWMNLPSRLGCSSFPLFFPSGSALTRGIYYCFARREHAMARTAPGEVGDPPSSVADRGPDHLAGVPRHVAPAGRRSARLAPPAG